MAARGKRRLETSARRARRAGPARAPEAAEGCQRRLVEDWRAERRANRDYEAYWERGVLERGAGASARRAQARSAAGESRGQDQHDRSGRAADEAGPRLHARLQRPGGRPPTADRGRRRDHHRGRRLRAARADDRPRRATSSRPPASKTRPGVVLADAGYWSNGHIDALARTRHRSRSSRPTPTPQRPRKTALGGPYDFMRRVIATERGDELYRQTTVHGRAGVRQNQIQPAHRPLQTTRHGGRPVRMAPDRGHPQPTQAPPPHDAVAADLTRAPATRHPLRTPTPPTAPTLRDSLTRSGTLDGRARYRSGAGRRAHEPRRTRRRPSRSAQSHAPCRA